MTAPSPRPKRPFRSWWFVDIISPDGRFNSTVLLIMVLFGMAIVPFVIIFLAQ